MYAGAVREAVFSHPEVIRRVNADFIPLALRATLVNRVHPAGDKDEEQLYQHLKGIMLAPQGVGVVNSDGLALEWVQMFRGEKDLLDFFDHSVQRFKEFPDATKACETERYLRYPDQKMAGIPNQANSLHLADSHSDGRPCPAEATSESRAPQGSLAVHVFGRALDAAGKLSVDTVRQEHYAQDHFVVEPQFQKLLAADLKKNASDRFPLPGELARQIVMHAYLGHIDVRPVSNPTGGKADTESWEFWAQRQQDAPVGLLRIDGKSDVVQTRLTNGQGLHEVHLNWEGYISMDQDRIVRLALLGRGTETLRFQNGMGSHELQRLPGGREIDFSGVVRFGILGEPGTEKISHAPQDDSSSFQGKMRRIQERAHKWQEQGRNLQPVHVLLQRFQPLMSEGKIQEAQAVLDEALALLEKEPPVGQAGPPPSLREKMEKFQQHLARSRQNRKEPAELEKFLQRLDPLLKEGKVREAEAVLDEALASLGKEADAPQEGPPASLGEKMQKLQRKMARLHEQGGNPTEFAKTIQRVELLLREGKLTEVEALLDELLTPPKEEPEKSQLPTTSGGGIAWLKDLEQTEKSARDQKKLVFLFFMLGDLPDPNC